MTIYLALLRGINVGGKNIIKMTELKQAFEQIGLHEVKTYIQSGNVLFKSNEEEETLQKKIEHVIEANFGLSVSVILRTTAEMEQIILNCPFATKELSESEQINEDNLFFGLMPYAPLQESMERLNAYKSDDDEFKIIGRNIFLLLRKGAGNSKLGNNLQKLDVPVTVRNWKTINKLILLAKSM